MVKFPQMPVYRQATWADRGGTGGGGGAKGAPCGQDITPYGSKPIFCKIIVHSNYCWEKRKNKLTFHHFRLHIHT